ncbi:S-Ena type endospore appendage [Calidifontibacillus erzurumensis]|uniref:S-Ena type endospore appendage n=1 Tax=Calidifontibacillus erzurumensis TaxID=2741433 RepID=UPI0035B55DDF
MIENEFLTKIAKGIEFNSIPFAKLISNYLVKENISYFNIQPNQLHQKRFLNKNIRLKVVETMSKKCKKDCKCEKCIKIKEEKVIECKMDKKFLKDCICAEWSVPIGQTQTVFQTEGLKKIFASGFVSFDNGQVPFITVTFFLDNNQVGDPIRVFNNSSVVFTYTKFNRITVSCPNVDSDDPDLHECEGEICITSRYPARAKN